jgi:quinol monooxygenase YgiN
MRAARDRIMPFPNTYHSSRPGYNDHLSEALPMIDVIATIRVKPGRREEFLAKFKANVPAVLAEQGCVHYYPTIDADSGISAQATDPNSVTVVEQWQSLDALHAHLAAPHMAAYRVTVKDIVEGVALKVLTKA